MTPAEYRTIAESLGLTQAFLAERTGVSEGRIWTYGSTARKVDVPQHAADRLMGLSNDFDEALSDAAGRIETARAAGHEAAAYRVADESGFWEEHPRLHGWPITAQGILLGHLITATNVRVVHA